MPSWSAELTWCGSELYLLGCSVPRGGLEIAAVDGACSPGRALQAEGCQRASCSISAERLAEENTHLVTLCHCVGHDTWSPAFFKAPSQSTSPVPPAELCGRLLYCFWIFPLHFMGESQARGVSTVTPRGCSLNPSQWPCRGCLWMAGQQAVPRAGLRQFQQAREWFSVQGCVDNCSCVALCAHGSPLWGSSLGLHVPHLRQEGPGTPLAPSDFDQEALWWV